MILTQLLGGMGNQMFQYAVGKHLAILNNTELKLDKSILINWAPGKHAVNRDFDLDIFNLEPNFLGKKEILGYHSDGASLHEKIFHKIRKQLTGKVTTTEQYFHFNPEVLQLKGNVYLTGTWQSYKYFEDIENEIKKDFAFRFPLNENSCKLFDKIKNTQAVCLNVRRTDYITVANTASTMAAVSMDYYKTAIQEMKKMIGEFEVFIFSDDIEWCKNNFGFINSPVEFVDYSHAGKKFGNYLRLMMACKNFIIPNSTFAWWAAWLNADEQKKVIAPVKWFNDASVNTNDLIPEQWIRL